MRGVKAQHPARDILRHEARERRSPRVTNQEVSQGKSPVRTLPQRQDRHRGFAGTVVAELCHAPQSRQFLDDPWRH
jgi:hypothetical protein